MSFYTVASRDFARDVSHAKRLAAQGPVFITDRGRPAYALLMIEDYYELSGQPERSLLQIMESVPGGDLDFDPPRMTGTLQPMDFE